MLKKKIITFLLWVQKHAKADMFYIVKNGSWMFFGHTVNSLLSLGLIVAFANLLPKETYGVYRYILSIAGVLNIFVLGGIGNAITRSVARGEEGVLIPALRYQAKWNLMMLAAFLCISGYYFLKENIVYATSFAILGIFVPFTLVFNNFHAYLKGKKKFDVANIVSVLATFIYSAGMLLTLFCTTNVVWLILTYCLSTFIPSVIFYFYVIRRFKLSDSSTNATSTIRYGRKLTFVGLIEPVVSQLDNILLMQFWGPAQLATYALATAIPNKAIPALKTLVNTGFPKFAVGTTQTINTVFYSRIFQGMIFGALVTIVYVLCIPFVFTYLLPQYVDSILYSQLVSISFIFALPNRYISLLLESQKLVRVMFINATAQGILMIVIYVAFGLLGGILGLILARILMAALAMIINIVLWRFHSRRVALKID